MNQRITITQPLNITRYIQHNNVTMNQHTTMGEKKYTIAHGIPLLSSASVLMLMQYDDRT